MKRILFFIVTSLIFVGCKTIPAPIETPETDAAIEQIQTQTNNLATSAKDASNDASTLHSLISAITTTTITDAKIAEIKDQSKKVADENAGFVMQVNSLNETIAQMKTSHEKDNADAAQSIAIAQKNESNANKKASAFFIWAIIVSCLLALVVAIIVLIKIK